MATKTGNSSSRGRGRGGGQQQSRARGGGGRQQQQQQPVPPPTALASSAAAMMDDTTLMNFLRPIPEDRSDAGDSSLQQQLRCVAGLSDVGGSCLPSEEGGSSTMGVINENNSSIGSVATTNLTDLSNKAVLTDRVLSSSARGGAGAAPTKPGSVGAVLADGEDVASSMPDIPPPHPDKRGLGGHRRPKYTIEWTKKTVFFLVIAVVVMIAVIVSIAMVVVLTNPGEEEDEVPFATQEVPTPSPTPLPVEQVPAEIEAAVDDILFAISDPHSLLEDRDSPQYKARKWILERDLMRDVALSEGDHRVAQRYVLAEFYYANGVQSPVLNSPQDDRDNGDGDGDGDGDGGDLQSSSFLLADESECQWEGVECDREGNEEVLYLHFKGMQLAGNLPSELAALTALRELDLSENDLSGPIPERWFLPAGGSNDTQPPWKDLFYLDISFNRLEGILHPGVWDLPLLRFLYANDNSFTGRVLRNNDQPSKSDKDLPTADLLEGLPFLQQVWLYNNSFAGPAPVWLLRLPTLQVWKVNHNMFTGMFLDQERGFALPGGLTYLDASVNNMTGHLPSYLFEGQSLRALYLEYNRFNGSLPLGDRPSVLEDVWLNNNQLSGQIPPGFGLAWENLTALRLQENLLNGTIGPTQCLFAWPDMPDMGVKADCSGPNASVTCSCYCECFQ